MKEIIRCFFFWVKNLFKYIKSGGVVYVNFATISNPRLLENKHIVIIGGSKGLGFTMARKFLEVGAKVTISGRSEERLKKAKENLKSDKVNYIVWDLDRVDNVQSHIEQIHKSFGIIDFFINNAGVFFASESSFFTQSVYSWDKTMNTNLRGLFFVCQKEIAYFLKRGGGKILNITSIGGVRSGYNAYDISKSSANNLTRGLAKLYASHNIIVNAIAPGEMPTEMGRPCDIHDNIYYSKQPNHRLTLTEDVAELAVFLMSDAANNIVGQVICCDGGASIN